MASLTVNHVRRTVLVATSGDTGGAVGAAFHGVPGFRVVILFPREGVSERQRRQMTTLGGNVTALAVQGSFDDCQRLAKEGFLDRELARTHALTSANSINVGRLLPQALYYVYAAATLGWDASPARFVVPCGNLGNLCAGLLANTAGMPAAAFLAATNSNSVFADFLHGSPFEPRSTTPTVSNAMDVGDPSNLERVLWLHGGDEDALRSRVRGVSIDDASTIRCIAEVHERTGYVLDPHTAVAFEAHRRHHSPPDVPSVVLATAHPAKFPEVVSEAIGFGVRTPPGINRTMQAEEHMLDIPPELNALRAVLDETSD